MEAENVCYFPVLINRITQNIVDMEEFTIAYRHVWRESRTADIHRLFMRIDSNSDGKFQLSGELLL